MRVSRRAFLSTTAALSTAAGLGRTGLGRAAARAVAADGAATPRFDDAPFEHHPERSARCPDPHAPFAVEDARLVDHALPPDARFRFLRGLPGGDDHA